MIARKALRRAPKGAGDARTTIGNEPELKFFDKVPTVWDDTKVLQEQASRGVCGHRAPER